MSDSVPIQSHDYREMQGYRVCVTHAVPTRIGIGLDSHTDADEAITIQRGLGRVRRPVHEVRQGDYVLTNAQQARDARQFNREQAKLDRADSEAFIREMRGPIQ